MKDPKKLALMGFEEGIGFVPFAGMGWEGISPAYKTDPSPVRAAAAKVLVRDPDPESGTGSATLPPTTRTRLFARRLWKPWPSVETRH